MDMYIKCGDLHGGTVIFDKMSKKTNGSWNALISGHLQLGQPLEACNLFLQMVNKCNLDLIALANGLLTCADLGYLLLGKAIHCRILRRGVHLDLVGTTALIDMYCKCKHLSAAMNIFHRTDTKDDALFNVMIAGYLRNGCAFRAIETFCEMVAMCVRPNTGTIISVLSALSDMGGIRTCKCIMDMFPTRQVFDSTKKKDKVSWTSMMTGLVNHGLANEAMTLFGLMQRENQHPDAVTFTCLLQALNQLGSVTLAKEVHGQFYRVFLEKDITLMNSLIATYSKWGKLKMASHLFEHMAEKHLSSWNTMIAAYACSHCGFVEEGLYAYSSMQEEYGITPSDEHYGCMVDLLSRAGRLEEAHNLLKHDPSRRNASTVGALLAACRIHGNTEMGERVGQWLLDVEPQNASAYCSVSNFYAGEGKWDEAAHLGAVAKGKGLKRTAGYSLIDF
ncbi:UNVERIFIED_CONTAM: Pentatricopeptide repeat-containing protein [Sesamum radiatum]|uniref:Pentatricopeptide repeat-containing protein n=1 Tax=Sesamum radiatum TaxID=300843 RepID=A0AAW2P4B2_SESRA